MENKSKTLSVPISCLESEIPGTVRSNPGTRWQENSNLLSQKAKHNYSHMVNTSTDETTA